MRGFVGVAVVFGLAFAVAPSARAATAERGYGSARFMLQVGNEQAALKSAEGGNLRGDVTAGADGNKHVASVSIQPLRATITPGDLSAFISSQLAGDKSAGAEATLQTIDFNMKVQRVDQFHSAMLTEVSFPALSAASKEPYDITVTLQPESVQSSSGGGASAKSPMGAKAKTPTDGMFVVSIPGMNFSRVAGVGAFKVSRKIAGDTTGTQRISVSTPGNWDVSNITLDVAESDAAAFEQWRDDFLVRGNNGDQNEKTMTIELTDPTGKTPLFSINCSGVGIVSTSRDVSSSQEKAAIMRVELYVEHATLGGGGATAAAATPPPAAADTSGAAPAAGTAPPAAATTPPAKTAKPKRTPKTAVPQ